jgi:tellurite methyltransferase
MSAEDRIRWDAIYRDRLNQPYPDPDPLLFSYTPRVPNHPDFPLRALDLAGGFGQNALWLASQGYAVDLVEISRVALNRARAEMAIRNLRDVNLLQEDMEDFTLYNDRYDLICVFRFLNRNLFPQICDALSSGGRIIYETFNERYIFERPDFNRDYLLTDGELPAAFPGWQVVFHDETSYVTQFVAIKP